MNRFEFNKKEKILLKSLATLQKGEELLTFLKDEFFVEHLLLVDDASEEIHYYFPTNTLEKEEVGKLQRLMDGIDFLRNQGLVTLIPYNHKKEKDPSIFWIHSTSKYSFDKDGGIILAQNIVLKKGYVLENGRPIMKGLKLNRAFYTHFQSLYAYVSVNDSLKNFIDAGFKMPDEIKTIKERIGGCVLSVIKLIKGVFT